MVEAYSDGKKQVRVQKIQKGWDTCPLASHIDNFYFL